MRDVEDAVPDAPNLPNKQYFYVFFAPFAHEGGGTKCRGLSLAAVCGEQPPPSAAFGRNEDLGREGICRFALFL